MALGKKMEVKTTKQVLENLPATWDGMIANYAEMPAGTDITPLLKGLPDDKCHSPHWGYTLKGSLHIGYADGTEEVIGAGDVWYMPPGHTVWADEDVALVFFSPEKEENEVQEHMQKRQEELCQGSG